MAGAASRDALRSCCRGRKDFRSGLTLLSSCATKSPMEIRVEEIRKVAELARLELSPDEEKRLAEQLDKILQYVEKLKEIETSGVEPLAHVGEIVNGFREDAVLSQPSADALLYNAPAREKNFFKVPKIIE